MPIKTSVLLCAVLLPAIQANAATLNLGDYGATGIGNTALPKIGLECVQPLRAGEERPADCDEPARGADGFEAHRNSFSEEFLRRQQDETELPAK